MKDINFALVEETRPPLYTAMKYWGKKPHNIWREYIKAYTPDKGLYLDPFAGSAISAFEAVKAGRKAIAFDLNPLTSFLIEAYCSPFDRQSFRQTAQRVISHIKKDGVYLEYFSAQCANCLKQAVAQHFKWDQKNLFELGIICAGCQSPYIAQPTAIDRAKSKKMNNIKIKYWHPQDPFHTSSSFSANFISCVGGRHFYNLWTKRNLYIISKIFDEILKTKNEDIKKQLLLGFIKTIHLCSKMCVPRRSGANRAFSTSWGRSAYICAARQMEMNPLLVFESSCFGKQSVESAMSSLRGYLGKTPKILSVDKSNKSDRSKNFDIKYGIIDICSIDQFVGKGSVDFILTDPPYGGLVQYLDLSMIWLIWLKKLDPKYHPGFQSEITIKDKRKDMDNYNIKFQKAVRNLYQALSPKGKIVFTFHNKDIKIWNAFLKSIRLANFKIEKIIHQQNRRTGESNVANPYGTSGADFYIRCAKAPNQKPKGFSEEEWEFKNRVIDTAKRIIAQRHEPTPYQILFNGILPEISSAGFDIEDFDINIEKILKNEIGKIFKITGKKDNGAGKYWWFEDPSAHIKYPDRDLHDRLELTISYFLRNKQSVSLDDVLGKVFKAYPNGLIPEHKSIGEVLKKYAYKSGSMWHYKGAETERAFTDHAKMLAILASIGRKLGFVIYIGKAEQSDQYEGKKLSEHADIKSLKHLNFSPKKRERVEMIDMLWLKNNQVKCAIEVENSTKFISGLQRASNLDRGARKIMVLPDERKAEFLNIRDPLFVKAFKRDNWSYLFYRDILRLKSSQSLSESLLSQFLNKIS